MGSDVSVVGGGITERADASVDVIGVEDGVDVIGEITGRTDAGVKDGGGTTGRSDARGGVTWGVLGESVVSQQVLNRCYPAKN